MVIQCMRLDFFCVHPSSQMMNATYDEELYNEQTTRARKHDNGTMVFPVAWDW